MPFQFKTSQDDFIAQLTDAAYHVLLRQGLRKSFVDVELELWREISEAARDGIRPVRPPVRDREALVSDALLVEVA